SQLCMARPRLYCGPPMALPAQPLARWTLLLVPFVLLGGAAAPARAQGVPDPEARGTRGVHIAGAARAGDADPTAVQLNPAQLGLLPAGGLTIAADIWRASALLPGRGVGVYTATPLGGAGGFGLALSHVAATPALGVEAHTVFQLAYAMHMGRFA